MAYKDYLKCLNEASQKIFYAKRLEGHDHREAALQLIRDFIKEAQKNLKEALLCLPKGD